MSEEVELVECYGGPKDGERMSIRADSYEIHFPKPIEPQWNFEASLESLRVEPLHTDVYHFYGYNPRNGFKVFRWSYET